MFEVSSNTYAYRMVRRWERNGKGPRVPHPFYFFEADIRTVHGNWGTSPLLTGGAGTGFSLPDTAMRLRLYSKFKDKAYSQFNMGENLAESKKTLTLIKDIIALVRHPLREFAYAVKAFKRRNPKKSIGRGLLRDLAQANLIFQYGIRPLMMDLYSACELLRKPYPVSKIRVKCAGIFQRPYTSGYPSQEGYYVERISSTVTYSAGAEAVMSNPFMFMLEAAGLVNPAAIAWELTPFSFVFDWFLPIGKWISSASDFAGVQLKNCYITTFSKTTGVRAYPNYKLPQSITDHSVFCQRTIGAPPGFPLASLIDLKLSQSIGHILNGLSLIAVSKRGL